MDTCALAEEMAEAARMAKKLENFIVIEECDTIMWSDELCERGISDRGGSIQRVGPRSYRLQWVLMVTGAPMKL
jgi:hypothetical protein